MTFINPMFRQYAPRLRFITEPDGNDDAAPQGDTAPKDLGYPADTATADMTDSQQAAYWKNLARKHEAVSRADYEALKVAATELETLKAASATDQEKALTDARRQGENIGAARYLMEAVHGRLLALTGRTDEELTAALDLIDVKKLTKADGSLDLEKLNAFGATLGKKLAPEKEVPPTDPVKAALERQKNGDAHRGSGSIAELTKQRVAALSTRK